MQPLR